MISVGSLDRFGDISKFSPHTPTDVYAPGEVNFPNQDTEIWGTSYATPAIGGIVLLLKQLANESVYRSVKENIHRVNVLKTIFEKMRSHVFQPVDSLLMWKENPNLLREIVEQCLQ